MAYSLWSAQPKHTAPSAPTAGMLVTVPSASNSHSFAPTDPVPRWLLPCATPAASGGLDAALTPAPATNNAAPVRRNLVHKVLMVRFVIAPGLVGATARCFVQS